MSKHGKTKVKKKEFFTSIAVNKQSNATGTTHTSTPDDAVYYPKLKLGNQCTSVDHLWMVGFLHHDKKLKERKVNE